MTCSGYRDTQQLRIENETQSIAKKALRNAPLSQLYCLPLSIDLQARDAFFAYYIASRCWDFLKSYHHPLDSPEHLTLAVDAVSLAYLWHQFHSDELLASARRKYILALRMINKILGFSQEAYKDTTLMVSLLLDLFEKITDSQPRQKSWTSHINGALSLVKLRGIEHFQDPLELSIVVRFSTHYIFGCVSSNSPVPNALKVIQAYIGKQKDAHDPMLRLSNLMIQYADLQSDIRRHVSSTDEYINLSLELDGKLQALDLELPPSWQYKSVLLDYDSDMVFDRHFHSYFNPRVCQARNVLRVMRLLLNQSLLQYHFVSPTADKLSKTLGVVHENIKILTGEICASVPQYVHCDYAVRQRLLPSEKSMLPHQPLGHSVGNGAGNSHTPNHELNCYTLIFPLFIAGRTNGVPEVRPWAIKQLNYIGSHFRIRNAEIVAQILERETNVDPWEVYAMLGSYAFAS